MVWIDDVISGLCRGFLYRSGLGRWLIKWKINGGLVNRESLHHPHLKGWIPRHQSGGPALVARPFDLSEAVSSLMPWRVTIVAHRARMRGSFNSYPGESVQWMKEKKVHS